MLQRPRLSRRDFPDCLRLDYAIECELGAAPPLPGPRPIGMTMRVLGFVVGSLGAGDVCLRQERVCLTLCSAPGVAPTK